MASTSWTGGIPWLVHATLIGVPAGIAVTFFDGKLFGYHPLLMAASFLLFMGEAVAVAIRAKGRQRKPLLLAHTIIQVFCLLAALGGFTAIYRNKALNKKPHFTSLHSRFGLVALTGLLCVAIGGLPAFFGLPHSLKHLTGRVNKVHKLFGTVTFSCGILTSILGLQVHNPSHPLFKGMTSYALAIGVLAVGFVTLIGSFALQEAFRLIRGSRRTNKEESLAV